jgi:hypothetical protein
MSASAATLGRGLLSRTAESVRGQAHQRASLVAFAGVTLLVFAAPFETREPLLRLPGQELSSVELVLVSAIVAWIVASAREQVMPAWRTPLTVPWLTLLAVMTVSALLSPHPGNALHMVGRLGLAFVVYLATLAAVATPWRRQLLMVAITAAGLVAAWLVIFEYLGLGPVMQALTIFRPGVALVGAQIRAGGPFQYPTIAAMFLEIAFAMALPLLVIAVDRRSWLATAAAVAAILLLSEAITLTFTRAGLLAMAAALGVVAMIRYRQHGVDRAVRLLALVAVLIGVQLVTSRTVESLRLRLLTEGQENWYRAEIVAPRELTIAARARVTVPVTLTNTGGNTWDPWAPQPFRLSYHWLLPDADRVVSWEGLRTHFPAPVAPGDTITLQADVEAPRHPGRYRLLWDIEQEHRLWFSTEPNSMLSISRATVTGDDAAQVGPMPTMPMPRKAVRPGRVVLWRAAARMIGDRSLLGVGPDNYRLMYGEYAGIVPADPRIHSNNMYLEIVAGAGVLGGLAFAWLLWRVAGQIRDQLSTAEASERAMAAGVAAAAVAIALHGIFDSFLSFTPTYVVISITLGLASSHAARAPHANRL